MKGGHRYTNRHVIPYNPYLSAKYNCHINVEAANSILAVKYLYKYIYKGHDRTCIDVQRDNDALIDEIREYLDRRYVLHVRPVGGFSVILHWHRYFGLVCKSSRGSIIKDYAYIDDWDVPPNTRVLLQSSTHSLRLHHCH